MSQQAGNVAERPSRIFREVGIDEIGFLCNRKKDGAAGSQPQSLTYAMTVASAG